MLDRKKTLLVAVLLALSVLLAGQARLDLDAIVGDSRAAFQEMLYLPRGDAMRVLAFGFNSPMADALYVKGLIYYSDALKAIRSGDDARAARQGYVYELFDVITDLNPRFARAYQNGSLFLTASANEANNLNGVALLEKAIRNADRDAAAGRPFSPDPRWMFHVYLANAYDVNLQIKARESGDWERAYNARARARDEFRKAAGSPGAPSHVMMAAAGYEAVFHADKEVEQSLEAVLPVWMEMHRDVEARGDRELARVLEERILSIQGSIQAIKTTKFLEAELARAARAFAEKNRRPPAGAAELAKAGLIPGLPTTPLGGPDSPDVWRVLPDGTFKSQKLSELETNKAMDMFQDALFEYGKANANAHPPGLKALVDGKYIAKIPEPPLAALGQRYDYDPETGKIEVVMPEGPELPPER